VPLSDELRDYFDQQLDAVMSEMPDRVHELLEEVTMYIEDHPPRQILRQMGIRRRDRLCGLYTGVPLNKKHPELSGVLSDAIYIYREGILAMVTDRRGQIDARELRRQIRITVLHELGHYHGLGEHELEDLGY
jgi:predicted Zn-dependent protease with MMP-like domain